VTSPRSGRDALQFSPSAAGKAAASVSIFVAINGAIVFVRQILFCSWMMP